MPKIYVLKSSTKLSIMAQAVIIILHLVRPASRLKLMDTSSLAVARIGFFSSKIGVIEIL